MENYDQPGQHIKKQRHYFVNKGLSSQGYGFSSGHVWMWELDYKESWAPKNWCFWTVVLKKTLESSLECKEIQPVHPKADQSCVFIGRTDVEVETPILWPPDAKNWLIWKDPDSGKDWGQEEKGITEDELVGCIADSIDVSLSELRELVMDREAWRAAVHGVAKSQRWLSDWNELKCEVKLKPQIFIYNFQILNLQNFIIYHKLAENSFGKKSALNTHKLFIVFIFYTCVCLYLIHIWC